MESTTDTTTMKVELVSSTVSDPPSVAASSEEITAAASKTADLTPHDPSTSSIPVEHFRTLRKMEPIIGSDGKPLSKNAMKKHIRQLEYLERRPQMRLIEKEKRKAKAQQRRDDIQSGKIPAPPKRQKLDQVHTGVTIGIDMAFDDLMIEKEIKSMVDQIKRCYSANRASQNLVHLTLTSLTGISKEELEKRANGFELWKNFTVEERPLEQVWPSEEIPGKARLEALKARVKEVTSKNPHGTTTVTTDPSTATSGEQPTTSSSATTAAPSPSIATSLNEEQESAAEKEVSEEAKALAQAEAEREERLATVPAVKRIVYLSADATTVLQNFESNTCYVLGGIVDKNRYPNLCQNKAEKLGLETMQLPIGEYIQLSSRRVLTVNQVFEIMVEYMACRDWKEAFLKVIPQRKLEEKKRVRKGSEAWKAKYGAGGKSRYTTWGPEKDEGSVASGTNSAPGTDHDDDGEDDDYGHDDSGDDDRK